MNEAQKIVLYELKEENKVTNNPFMCVRRVINGDLIAYSKLKRGEEFEVLAEFAEWGLKREN